MVIDSDLLKETGDIVKQTDKKARKENSIKNEMETEWKQTHEGIKSPTNN